MSRRSKNRIGQTSIWKELAKQILLYRTSSSYRYTEKMTIIMKKILQINYQKRILYIPPNRFLHILIIINSGTRKCPKIVSRCLAILSSWQLKLIIQFDTARIVCWFLSKVTGVYYLQLAFWTFVTVNQTKMLFFLHTINDVVFFLTFTRRVKILKLAKFSFFFFKY